MLEPDEEKTAEDHEALDAETIMQDAQELFGAEDDSPPMSESDAPAPG